jgi:hypothetical protein
MNIYYLIYYRIFKATKKTNRVVVEWTSMVALSTLIFLNLAALLIFIYPDSSKTGLRKEHFILATIVLLVINYFVFIYKGKYLHIYKTYSKIKWINSFAVGLLVIIYIIGSVYCIMHALDNVPTKY